MIAKFTPKPKQISQEMILDSTGITRSSRESTESYLKRITHLHLQLKKITSIEHIVVCPKLKVLYLYDNFIERIDALNMAIKLEFVQIQNNLITIIPDLHLPKLQKIFLDNNQISFIAGLEDCTQLRSLSVSNQKLPENQPLQFDPKSLLMISMSLITLDISGNHISSLQPFHCLAKLEILNGSNNDIMDLTEITELLKKIRLIEVDFSNNPCNDTKKYRDTLISSSEYLEILDNVPVDTFQRTLITQFMKFHEMHSRNKLKTNLVKINNIKPLTDSLESSFIFRS